jgi:HK97 family phage major capsid protein
MKKKNVIELLNDRSVMITRREQINIRLNEIDDTVNAEKREKNDAEKSEYNKLQSEFAKLTREIGMNYDEVNVLTQTPEQNKSRNTVLREALQGAKKEGNVEFALKREITTATLEAGGLIPVTINDVLPPLELGLIYDKIGVQIETGVSGNLVWPLMGNGDAEILGETEELTDETINFDKINAIKTRVGVSFSVSNSAINDSNEDLVSLIQREAQMRYRRTINRVMFSHQNFTGNFHGPFAGAKAQGTFEGKTPTFAELMEMKGKVAEPGVEMDGFAFVMSETMKARLEATPIDAGSGRMIVEGGKIGGYPVFTTAYINYSSTKEKANVEYVGAGVWSYLALNQYGDLRMTVDYVTEAKKDKTVVTLNSEWSMTTLRSEAFALYKTQAQ